MHYKIGQQIFISYRGSDYQLAVQAGVWLQQQRYCNKVMGYEPNSLTVQGEALRLYKYFELVEAISDHMVKCDGFVYIDTNTYLDSIFTSMEQMYWSYFRTAHLRRGDHIEVYRFIKNGD